jgi:hypothetical protein
MSGVLREDLSSFIVPVDIQIAIKGLLIANVCWRIETIDVLCIISPLRHKNVRGLGFGNIAMCDVTASVM